MSLDVYAFGSALVDIQLHVSDSAFATLGITKGNMYLTDRAQQEAALKKLLGDRIEQLECAQEKLQTAAGGSAANTVYGIAQLGGTAALCGKVADDAFGTLYIRHLHDSGVLFSEKRVSGMTGSCIVLISDDAQRTMLTCLGVSSEIGPEDIDEQQLLQSSYAYLEGYLFDSETATRTLVRTIELAKKHGVKIALTASDAFCVERHKTLLVQLLREKVDLLFANAQEAQALTGTDNTTAAVTALAGMCKQVAVTDGAHGSVLSFDGEVKKIEPYMVSPLDTTGAGDSYAAGLLFGITHGYSLENSGRLASFFAARVVSQIGPRYNGDIRQESKSLRLHG